MITRVISRVVVAIPACNEQDVIVACLDSVSRACRAVEAHSLAARTRGAVRTRIVVALDACTDNTADAIADYPGVEAVQVDVRRVGSARRAAAARAIDPADADLANTWLANTDADCTVPTDWLVRMVAHADAGHDLVLGTVRPLPGLSAAQNAAWLDAHDYVEGHPHVHGANLGIRASTYVALGGWADLVCDEDVDLVTRAESHGGVSLRRSADSPVLTSSRMHGRVEHGFAEYLRTLRDRLAEPNQLAV